MTALHERIARIARQEFSQLYASVDDQAEAMAAALITELGLTEERFNYEEQEVTAVMGGEGVMCYGGQTIRSLGWRTKTRIVSPWERAE